MTDEQLTDLKKRAATSFTFDDYTSPVKRGCMITSVEAFALLAEVDRLRAQVAELEERDRSWHNASNWSAEELGRLRAQVAELEPLAQAAADLVDLGGTDYLGDVGKQTTLKEGLLLLDAIEKETATLDAVPF